MLERLLLSPREAAYKLGGISVRHLWALTRPRGPIPCIKLGRRTFYRPSDLEAFLESVARQQAEAAELVEGQDAQAQQQEAAE
jgi:hypothetical protein